MNFNHLLIFHKVAEKEHFTHAAEALYISQPAVSKQVHELERSLGLALFVQVGRNVHLTEAGRTLFDYTRRIFALSEEAEMVLGEMHGLKRGRLLVGASTTIGTYLLPELLGIYRQRYPHITLALDIANATEIQQRLLHNRIEVGIIEGAVTHDEICERFWRQDQLVLIAPTDTPLLAQHHLTIEALLHEPFILREPGSGTRTVLEEALSKRGLPPLLPSMELGSTEAIKKAVAAGLGLSFVSEHTIQMERAAQVVVSVPLLDFTVTRSLSLIYLKQRRLSRAAQMFLEVIGLSVLS
jgi:DNA-binding transcriptional LysR family regulator